MRRRGFRPLGQAGISLVEVMIGGAILLGLFLAIDTQFLGVRHSISSASRDLMARSVLAETISRISSSPGEFPPVFDPRRGSFLTYAACLNGDGAQIPSNLGSIGFVGNFALDTHKPITVPTLRRLARFCPDTGGGMEIHVTPTAVPRDVAVVVLLMPIKGVGTPDIRPIFDGLVHQQSSL